MADEEVETSDNQEKKGSSNTLLIVVIILLFLTLIIGAMVAFFVLSSDDTEMIEENTIETQEKKKKKKNASKNSDFLTIGPIYALDQFIVNLISNGGRRYLKTSINLEIENEEMMMELDSKKPLIRDIIIRILSSKTFEEVSTKKGKINLKEELKDNINEVLTDGNIQHIFLTSFVIQ